MATRLARSFAACGMAAMALSGCGQPEPGRPAAPAPPVQTVTEGQSLYDIQGPPNPLWDRAPIDPAKMLTLTYTMKVRMAGHTEPQTVEIKTLGYCETVEDERDYAAQCRTIIGEKLAWHAHESLEESAAFDLHIPAADPAIRPYALFDRPALIRALGALPKTDLYTVLSLKPR